MNQDEPEQQDIAAQDFAVLEERLIQTASYAAKILADVAERPPLGDQKRAIVPKWPAQPLGLEGALRSFVENIDPGLQATAGPRYFGFVTGGTTPAALVGDWLAATFDNSAASGAGVLAEVERHVLEWLKKQLGLSPEHRGAFVTGATASNYVCLATAREWAGEQLGVSISDDGMGALPQPIRVLSASPHSSAVKALAQLGLGRNNVEIVASLPDREAVDLQAMRQALAAQPDRPTILIANAGTVNTVDFDDLAGLVALRDEYGAWLHVDGAFGAFAAVLPEYAHYLDGLAAADSVTLDLHKWLNVPYDSAVQYTKRQDLQVKVFQNVSAYLGAMTDPPDFLHLTPENSRRARAIPAWFTIAAYGVEGLQGIVRRNIEQAQRFGVGVAQLDGARLLAPVRINVACFTTDADPKLVLSRINSGGEVFMTPSNLGGIPCIRAAFSNWRTTDADVDLALEELARALVSD